MNPATRLNELLVKIQNITPQSSAEQKSAIKVFENIFEVSGCIAVAKKLKICNLQIKQLEDGAHPNLIKYLNVLFDDKDIERNIIGLCRQVNNYIITLHTVGHHMADEIINENELKELGELVEQMRSKVEKAEISDEQKTFVYEYINEIMEGIADIHIGGIESFNQHLIIATGTYAIHHEAFVESKLTDTVSAIYEKSTKILSDSQTWVGAIGFIGGKFLGAE